MTKKYKLVDTITDQVFPHNHKLYPEAHSEACQEEKKKYPKLYEEAKEFCKQIHAKYYMGMNDKNGNLFVAKRVKTVTGGMINVPEKFRVNTAYHEEVEAKAFKRLEKDHPGE